LTTTATRPIWGEIMMLVAAICILRVLPAGVTGRYFRGEV
jgi:branched-chain amino acid transport system permease protein